MGKLAYAGESQRVLGLVAIITIGLVAFAAEKLLF